MTPGKDNRHLFKRLVFNLRFVIYYFRSHIRAAEEVFIRLACVKVYSSKRTEMRCRKG